MIGNARPALVRGALGLALILGETCAFAAGGDAAMLAVYCLAGGCTAAAIWGWRVTGGVFLQFFLFGLLLGLRCEALRLDFEREVYAPRTRTGLRPRILTVTEVVPANAWELRRGPVTVFLSTDHGVPLRVIVPVGTVRPQAGDVWSCAGWVRAGRAGTLYARRTLTVAHPEDAHRIRDGAGTWRRGLARLREALCERAGVGLARLPEIAALNRAILFGERSAMRREDRETFAAAGTVHVFAISGLHVMTAGGIIVRVLSFLRMPRGPMFALATAGVVAYVFLTGARPSAIRAAVMTFLCFGAAGYERKPDLLTGWTLSVLAVFGWNPRLLFDVGCMLSFTVMLGIALVLAFSPPRARDGFAVHTQAERWFSAWTGGLVVTFAAWWAGVPLVARFFGRFTLGGLVANLAVLPLATCTVMFGFFGTAASFVSSSVGGILNNLAALSTWGMKAVSEGVAAVPGSSFEIEPWSWGVCAVWWGAAVLLILMRYVRCRR